MLVPRGLEVPNPVALAGEAGSEAPAGGWARWRIDLLAHRPAHAAPAVGPGPAGRAAAQCRLRVTDPEADLDARDYSGNEYMSFDSHPRERHHARKRQDC